jgi:hypothetical protein
MEMLLRQKVGKSKAIFLKCKLLGREIYRKRNKSKETRLLISSYSRYTLQSFAPNAGTKGFPLLSGLCHPTRGGGHPSKVEETVNNFPFNFAALRFCEQ